MQLHQLKPIHQVKKGKRIGRGGKKGWTSGRGSKGQRSRAGRRFQPLIRQLIKRYPKLRGHRSKLRPERVVAVNLKEIERVFAAGETVNPRVLLQKGVVVFPGKKTPVVKILAEGELTKALVFEKCRFSQSAREKIEKSRGQIKND